MGFIKKLVYTEFIVLSNSGTSEHQELSFGNICEVR